MALSIAIKPLDVKPPQYHEFKVGKSARNIWADKAAQHKRAEELKRRQLVELRRKAEAKRAERIKQAEQTKRSVNVEASFYTAYCPEGCTGRTATGVDVSKTQFSGGRRIIATDPSVIPLGTTGTLTLANGMSFAVIAADTGGAIRGNKIDVLVASESEARRLGRQSAVLTID